MARRRDDYDDHDDAGWFRDQLRQRDREIADLRREKDELNDLIWRLEEYIADCNGVMEAWRDTFDIKETDKGVWTWELGSALGSPRNALARRFDRRVRLVHERDVGRPLAASEEDVAVVTKMHKDGKSLRRIAEEMELG